MTRILVVDDQAFVRETIRLMLEDRTAWELFEAENGKVALEVAKKEEPDVVVLDLVMPVMGGLEAAYEIGHIAPNAKIIFVSSHYASEQVEHLIRLFGAARFLSKAELGQDLIPTIKKLLWSDATAPG